MSDSVNPARAVQFQWHNLAILGVIVLALALLWAFRPTEHHNAQLHRGVGKTLAALGFQPLTEGTPPVTASDLAGKVVLIDFWGPWRWWGSCRAQIVSVAKLYQKYGGRSDFKLCAVSCGQGGKDNISQLRTATNDYLKKAGIDLPVYADPEETARASVDKVAGFDAFPTAVLLDREGVIRAVWTGFPPDRRERISQRMDELIGQLLEEKK
jgi:thiol-disulfide isomerase/thioredoxin